MTYQEAMDRMIEGIKQPDVLITTALIGQILLFGVLLLGTVLWVMGRKMARPGCACPDCGPEPGQRENDSRVDNWWIRGGVRAGVAAIPGVDGNQHRTSIGLGGTSGQRDLGRSCCGARPTCIQRGNRVGEYDE